MKDKNILSWICSGITTLTALASTNEILQIILTTLGVFSAVVSLSYNIYLWYRKAKKDGKIDEDEVKDLKDTLDKGIKDVYNKVEKGNKDHDEKP